MAITRDAANVWAEICAKAEKHRVSKEPVYTLCRAVPNLIVKVEKDRILRRSQKPYSKKGESWILRSDIERIWNALRKDGRAIECKPVYAPRFAWALVGRFIEGLKCTEEEGRFALVVADEQLANRVFGGRVEKRFSMSQAADFRSKGRVKEFITEDGETYIILGFPDNTPLVLQKVRGKGKASACFKRVKEDKTAYKKLGATAKNTYQQGLELLQGP